MKQLKRIVTALVIAALLMPFALPALSEAVPAETERTLTQDKLTAFFNYVTPSGLRNGDLWYSIEFPPYLYAPPISGEYNGDGVVPYTDGWEFYISALALVGWSTIDENGIEETWDALYPICPDFCGPLDLSGTTMHQVVNEANSATHITSINLSDCGDLTTAELSNQPCCTEVLAVNCEILMDFFAENGGYRHIAVQPRSFEAPVDVRALGLGTVGARYEFYHQDRDTVILSAYPAGWALTGWYVGGEIVSADTVFDFVGSGSAVAVFGGDADGDGSITVADALLAMRGAMGLIEADEVALDMNASGGLDIADALLLLRLSMGVA